MDEYLKGAHDQLQRVKTLCSRVGLEFVELPPQMVGVGLALGFGPNDFVILSVMGGGSESALMITSGLLKQIQPDRTAALEAANHLTRERPSFPVYLHDAEAGWALLMQQSFPIQLLSEVPGFFDANVRGMPGIATEARATIRERWDLGGLPWEWTVEDLNSLLLRSMM